MKYEIFVCFGAALFGATSAFCRTEISQPRQMLFSTDRMILPSPRAAPGQLADEEREEQMFIKKTYR